jgi:hypothetical protein
MSTQENRTRETIEETGKVFEKFGLTPMQGRIVSFFTVSDPLKRPSMSLYIILKQARVL